MINYSRLSKFIACLLLWVSTGMWAQNTGDWLVKLSGKLTPYELFQKRDIPGKQSDRLFFRVSESLNIWRVCLTDESDETAVWLRSQTEVLSFQQNYALQPRGIIVPNDPLFESQWHLLNLNSPKNDIDASAAWNYTTGGVTPAGDTVVVAVIDAGFNAMHPDLEPNRWINTGEVPGDGVDNDENGYCDDYRGWNVIAQNDDISGTATLHGNGVAGIIGAAGNNEKGITGVNWRTKLMFVAGGNTIAGIIAACDYIRTNRKLYNESNGQKGACVVAVNTSWGLDYGFPADAPLWCEMIDLLGAEGILTIAATANNPVNIDVAGDLPATCPSESLVTVTSLSGTGQLASGSSWGPATVDLATHGEGILSLTSQGYGIQSGSSFAAPCVAGAVGLLYSASCPELTILQESDPFLAAQHVRALILSTVDSSAVLHDLTVSGGKLNLGNLLSTYEKGCPDCPQPFVLRASVDVFKAVVTWHSSSGASSFQVKWRIPGGSWIYSDTIQSDSLVLDGLQSCAQYEFQARARCSTGWSEWSQAAMFLTEGCCSAPNMQVTSVAQSTSVALSWSPPEFYTIYRVLYKKNGSPEGWMVSVADSPGVLLSGLAPCTAYDVRIFGYCLDGWNLLQDNLSFLTRGCGACYDNSYCTAFAQSAQEEWIARVKLGNWEHVSEQGGSGYQNFSGKTDSIPVLASLSSVPLSVTPGFWGGGYKEYYRVYIDYNFNGIFEEPGELAFDSGFSLQGTLSGVVQTPYFDAVGVTRMRIIMKYMDINPVPPGPCTTFEFGQVEDYCVELRSELTDIDTGTYFLADDLLVMPVPATNWVHIARESGGELHFQVVSGDGQQVATGYDAAGVVEVDVSNWPPGVYYLQARAGSKVWHRTLLKLSKD